MSALLDSAPLAELLTANPTDTELRTIYADALEEAGQLEEAMRQRDYVLCIQSTRYAHRHLTHRQETRLRKIAGASRCPINVIPGDSPPTAHGERASNVFKGTGGECHYPGAAMRAGYKVKYIQSTLRVEVGVLWLIKEGYLR